MRAKLTVIMQVIGIVLLLTACLISGKHPAFFQFLRWAICLLSAYLAYVSFRDLRPARGIAFAIPLVVFNPILQIHMQRTAWQWVNASVIILYAVSIWLDVKARIQMKQEDSDDAHAS